MNLKKVSLVAFIVFLGLFYFWKKNINRRSFESSLVGALQLVEKHTRVDSFKYFIDYSGCNCAQIEFYGLLKNNSSVIIC